MFSASIACSMHEKITKSADGSPLAMSAVYIASPRMSRHQMVYGLDIPTHRMVCS